MTAQAKEQATLDEMIDYTVRCPNGRVVTFVGRIVEQMPCELFNRKTREFSTGVRLVLEDANGKRLTTVGMRAIDAQEMPRV